MSSTQGSPGAAIREARTRGGLSLDELASRTRLSRATLQALENDAFEQLLEPVYVRGYYRKVARILGVDEQSLISDYEAAYTPAPVMAPSRLRLASGGELGSVQRVPRRLAVLAPMVAIVLCAVIWLLRDWSPSTPAGSAATTLTPIDSTVLPATDVQPPLETAADPMIDPSVPAVVADPQSAAPTGEAAVAAPADPAAAAAGDATVAATAPPTGSQLILNFDAISWARVEDASGKSLVSGVIGAGEQRVLDGRPPYSVFLGNAPGVRMQFGGQPVDLRPYVKKNSTARFSIPATGG